MAKYKVIREESVGELEIRVNMYLQEGWVLMGSVVVEMRHDFVFYLQTIINKG